MLFNRHICGCLKGTLIFFTIRILSTIFEIPKAFGRCLANRTQRSKAIAMKQLLLEAAVDSNSGNSVLGFFRKEGVLKT